MLISIFNENLENDFLKGKESYIHNSSNLLVEYRQGKVK